MSVSVCVCVCVCVCVRHSYGECDLHTRVYGSSNTATHSDELKNKMIIILQ